MNFRSLVEKQRNYFQKGSTKSYEFRLSMLQKLQSVIKEYESLFNEAMKNDMNKCPTEVYMTEIGMVLEELSFHIRHLSRWMRNKRVSTSIAQFPAKSFISPEPYGVALIMSPWNYPIQLCLLPLIGAISAGCTAVVKPSAYAPATSKAIAQILRMIFPEEYIAVVEGGRDQNRALLEEKFDYIFFTGSPAVGRLVMESAARYLTPITLELGGKSPVIVDKTANLKVAARRIAFGKVLNAGQTCVEPDYLFIHRDVKDEFIKWYKSALQEFFPNGRMTDMNTIINEKHFKRVSGLLESGKIVSGGNTDQERRFVEPTLLDEVPLDSPIMQEEIFGPILPMISFIHISECTDYIMNNPKPLALYLFTNDSSVEKYVLDICSFGGGCINDTIIHLANSNMGFGGVGNSGMGSYHGKRSFDTFTHYRSIVKKATWLDIPIRYRPYSKLKDKLLRIFLK
ncbi:aldehyde dehydrogenase [Sedimentibacter sp. MB31-C6]|uniref:aldehyde dehydrogenase n=1 Tax=Sedimentibacter sp. MB31-C6 TaxID=3109366 RepID=UPI002DDCD967|nr:aldehyde dehydrogenase [Sedimentibacter sp. MB36-C1]WSI04632.1 aldehyde dehydrogenase [Sedimentibacter sp. MB36-C1]